MASVSESAFYYGNQKKRVCTGCAYTVFLFMHDVYFYLACTQTLRNFWDWEIDIEHHANDKIPF